MTPWSVVALCVAAAAALRGKGVQTHAPDQDMTLLLGRGKGVVKWVHRAGSGWSVWRYDAALGENTLVYMCSSVHVYVQYTT